MFCQVILLFCLIQRLLVTGFVFEGEERRRIADKPGERPVRTRRPTNAVSPSTIDSIFQIPISVIQGTSAAAQSWYPENGDTINKVFDIPVQTLQAVGNLVKDRIPPRSESQSSRARVREQRQTRSHEFYSPRRHPVHSDGWSSAFGLFVGGYGHKGPIWGGRPLQSSWNSPGPLHGGHGLHGHKKKKKKKKQHGGHLGHGSHFGGSGQVHEILGGDDNVYHVTEDVDDAVPIGLFSWNHRQERIQNKVAPRDTYP